MLKLLIFAVAMCLVDVYALWHGQQPEKVTAISLSLAFIATVGLPYNAGKNFDHIFIGLMVVDCLLFFVLFAIAMIANRYWPIWLAGLQLLTILVHLVKLYDPMILPIIYARVAGEIGYPMLALLALGTRRLHLRLKLTGRERDWAIVL